MLNVKAISFDVKLVPCSLVYFLRESTLACSIGGGLTGPLVRVAHKCYCGIIGFD